MPAVAANGITIEYAESGPAEGSAIVLIRGLGTQLIYWPQEFYQPMAAAGHRVIRFDNRDVGLSSQLDDLGEIDIGDLIVRLHAGEIVETPYTLDDMAADILGLMMALQIARAHMVGISLGGMIAQSFAGNYPDQTLSMTSIMSRSGNPDLPPPAPEILRTLRSPPGERLDRAGKIANEVRSMQLTGSPGYPVSDAFARDLAARAYDRAYHPAGVNRQMAAALGMGDRRPRLNRIKRPTLVVHGTDDVLVPLACGLDTARNIPGAAFVEVPGMGHNIPPSLGSPLAEIVLNHIAAHDG